MIFKISNWKLGYEFEYEVRYKVVDKDVICVEFKLKLVFKVN